MAKKSKPKPEEGSPEAKLAQAQALLGKVFKTKKEVGLVKHDYSSLKKPLPHVSTGVIALDNCLAGAKNAFGVRPCPGFPKGKIIQIWGAEHVGKTSLVLQAAASVIKEGGSVCFLDYEYALAPDYAYKILGVPVSGHPQFQWVQPESLEQGIKTALVFMASGYDMVIIDSVGAAMTQNTADQSAKDIGQKTGGGLGEAARVWSASFPKIRDLVNQTKAILLVISQSRAVIGGFGMGPKTAPQGGRAWGYYTDIRLELFRKRTHKANIYDPITNKTLLQPFAVTVGVKVRKCKVSSATGREAEYYLRFGDGIDNLWTLVEIAKAHKILKVAGAWVTWFRSNGEDLRMQGLVNFQNELAVKPNLLAEFQAQVMAKLDDVDSSSPEEDDEPMDLMDAIQNLDGMSEEDD